MPRTIMMPALSAGMEEGTIARWLKPVGAAVAKGDVLVEIETDKATMEYEAEEGGILGAIMADDGATVPVNTAIAMLLLEGEDNAALAEVADISTVATPPVEQGPMDVPVSLRAEPEVTRSRRLAASPLARRLARQRNIALEGLSGSGARGRIVRIDIERASQTAVAAPAVVVAPPASPSVAQPFAPPQAHSAAPGWEGLSQIYLTARCEVDALLDLRARLNEAGCGTYTLLVNDFVVRAAALALREVPNANVGWIGSSSQLYDNIDISMISAAEDGLVTSIVRHADSKGLAAISAEIGDFLADSACASTPQGDDNRGGSGFTVVNLGAFGVESAGVTVNAPRGCVLTVGAAERRAVVKGDACVPATVMSCTLSVDHRLVDAAVGARWLAVFKALIEQPLRLVA
ncbi:MAG: hypothetical protein BGP16_18165 [Sphingobium sp. 66-54]|nr:MAG: hypothetical protein BGP16_18165 [Sphingobium sp. 66-54]